MDILIYNCDIARGEQFTKKFRDFALLNLRKTLDIKDCKELING